jgi:hypothetical protein
MRIAGGFCILLAALALVIGCGPKKITYKDNVNKFTGRLVKDGKPVSFPPGDEVMLEMQMDKQGDMFVVPIKNEDGTFNLTWMPRSNYKCTLMWMKAGEKGEGPVPRFGLPDYTVQEEKEENLIELGKNVKIKT